MWRTCLVGFETGKLSVSATGIKYARFAFCRKCFCLPRPTISLRVEASVRCHRSSISYKFADHFCQAAMYNK